MKTCIMVSLKNWADRALLKNKTKTFFWLRTLGIIYELSSHAPNKYYSNFDKHRYDDFHRAQCTEATHLALDIFPHFGSKSARVFENELSYSL